MPPPPSPIWVRIFQPSKPLSASLMAIKARCARSVVRRLRSVMTLPAKTVAASVMSARKIASASLAEFSKRGSSGACRRAQFKNSNLNVGQSASSPAHFCGPAWLVVCPSEEPVAMCNLEPLSERLRYHAREQISLEIDNSLKLNVA